MQRDWKYIYIYRLRREVVTGTIIAMAIILSVEALHPYLIDIPPVPTFAEDLMRYDGEGSK